MVDVVMPQLGETVEEGTVTKWLKNVGEHIVAGEALLEISTDKVDTEIPALSSGVLTAILVAEGVTADVGAVLAVIAGNALPPSSAGLHSDEKQRTVAKEENVANDVGRTTSLAPNELLSPVVRRLLEEHSIDSSAVLGTGRGGRLTRNDVLSHLRARSSTVGTSAVSRSPLVRRLMRDRDIDASTIVGSGPRGTILRRDVEAISDFKRRSPGRTRSRGDEVIPFTNIRRRTAEHMTRSKAISAHTLMVREVSYERVETVRRTHGATFKQSEGFSLTYLPFIAVAAIAVLREFPYLNASIVQSQLVVHHDLNLGFAVDLSGDGLVVPVIRNADELNLREVARRIRKLADSARSRRLIVDDLTGGTFTITNPGPYGTLLTGAVINQPQVAILSTDAVTRRPVVVTTPDGGEGLGIQSVGNLALTFDHRAIDGAYAARFLGRVEEIIDDRDWAAELAEDVLP